jgi:hypothetical protein
MIVEGGVPAYFWGDRPPNLLDDYNPSFERTAPTWTFTNPHPDSQSWHGDGCWSAHTEVTLTGGEETAARSPLVPVTAGKTYSARIIANVGSETELGWRVSLEWYNDAGRIDDGGKDSRGNLVHGSSIRTGVVTGTAPKDATRVRVRFTSGTERPTQLFTGNLDNAILVEGGVPTSYYGPTDPYPTSTCYGGANRTVDTDGEIADVRAALGDTGYLHDSIWPGLSPADQARIYPTSWDSGNEGGEGHSVDTPGEVAAVRTALGDTGYLNGPVWDGLSPADQPRIYPTSWTYGARVTPDYEVNTFGELALLTASLMSSGDDEALEGQWADVSPQDRVYADDQTDAGELCHAAFALDQNAYETVCLGRPEGAASAAGYNLNPEEKAFCHSIKFVVCTHFYRDSRVAVEMTERLFSGVTGKSDSTEANAFQHAVWVALMINSWPGNGYAYDFAVAHENHAYDASNPNVDKMRDSRMDIVNDQVGREIGNGNWLVHGDTYMCNEVLDEIAGGEKLLLTDDPYANDDDVNHSWLVWREDYTTDGIYVSKIYEDC